MSDIVTFLTARLDELEEAAREASPRRWFSADNFLDDVNGGTVARFEIAADARHAGLYDPVSVLADITAKRRIVEAYRELRDIRDAFQSDEAMGAENDEQAARRRGAAARCRGLEIAVELLALPDADHPDYRQEWKP